MGCRLVTYLSFGNNDPSNYQVGKSGGSLREKIRAGEHPGKVRIELKIDEH